MHSPPPSADHDVVWEPCGACWGQRVIWSRPPGGHGMRSRGCDACLGVGERAVAVPARRGPAPRA